MFLGRFICIVNHLAWPDPSPTALKYYIIELFKLERNRYVIYFTIIITFSS